MKRALLIAGIFAGLALQAQTPGLPPMEPGDVAFVDPSTNAAYLLWRSHTGRLEAVPPYTPEQIYWLMLQREQAAWDVFNAYADSAKVQQPINKRVR